MESIRRQNPQAALISLEAQAASARGGFACLFSTAAEYERERRAQGRYTPRRSYRPLALFIGCALIVAGTVLLFA
ncbi:hypothetical protein ACRQ5Q_19830 [Bradyrhizobium sp. PMVTL-01]|uniref:hypothetical protein n=1 Tax=unclassified Bradyrhizobium TaxID=2631580 RepID=UPI003F719641